MEGLIVPVTSYREPSPRQSWMDIQGVLIKAAAYPAQGVNHWLALLSAGARDRLAAEALELLIAASREGDE